MAPVKVGERVYQVGDRVKFCGWPSTIVHVNEPCRWYPRYSYHVQMDAGPYARTTNVERTAIGVRSEDLEPLCEE